MNGAIALGIAGWGSLFLFSLGLIYVLTRRDPPVPLPDPAFREHIVDLHRALEPIAEMHRRALEAEHDALLEDVEVAWLESIPVLPYDTPGGLGS